MEIELFRCFALWGLSWKFESTFQVGEIEPEPDLLQQGNKEDGLSEHNWTEQIENKRRVDPINQDSTIVSIPKIESEVKSFSGLALEDLRLQHYEKKLPQKEDATNCDALEASDTATAELESKIRLVTITSGSLDEKPYTELSQPVSSMSQARRNSLNLCNNKNSHVSF